MTPPAIAAILGGIVAAALTLAGVILSARWRLTEENITKERAKWRDAVRSIVAQAVEIEASTENGDTKIRRLWGEIALRMNPGDDPEKDDRQLVDAVASLVDPAKRTDQTRLRILDLAAGILKHDWERAKWEARGRPWEQEPEQTSGSASKGCT